MIKREDFPYIYSLTVKDVYAVKGLTIPISDEGDFKNLIITGKNGSGKTTVLASLANVVRHDSESEELSQKYISDRKNFLAGQVREQSITDRIIQDLSRLDRVKPNFKSASNLPYHGFLSMKNEIIIAYFEASRKVHVKDVETVSKDSEIIKSLESGNHHVSSLFKQYLVNKKVFQVFDAMEGKNEIANQQEKFFKDLETLLAEAFESPGLKLEFVRENFEFYIRLKDGRRITFNQLSAGFSAFLSILTDLLLRTDLIRKQVNDYSYDPCGFVFIDEPETHLHIEMQYQILYWLTKLFPNLQFIVATHSPAVASSIKNATVFDLSSGDLLGSQAAGSSYSELMQTHFGIENEFSNVADAIILRVKQIAKNKDPRVVREQLTELLDQEDPYLSPLLRLEIETILMGLDDNSSIA
jgi:predicted ATP-binding protein involved in virulence